MTGAPPDPALHAHMLQAHTMLQHRCTALYDGTAASGRMEDGLKAEGGASHRLGMVSEHAAPCGPVRRAAASPLALHPHAQHTSAHNGLKSHVLTGEAGYIYSSHCP